MWSKNTFILHKPKRASRPTQDEVINVEKVNKIISNLAVLNENDDKEKQKDNEKRPSYVEQVNWDLICMLICV